MRAQLIVAVIMEALDGGVVDGGFIGSTCRLVQGWFGKVSQWSNSLASPIMSKHIGRVHVVLRLRGWSAN